VAGKKGQIDHLRALYNAGMQPSTEDFEDPHAVAGVLKLFLRSLADPIVPNSKSQTFLSLGGKEEQAWGEKLSSLMTDLPECHQAVLNYFIHFLTQLCERSALNKMDAKNCALIFAPSMLRPNQDAQLDQADPQAVLLGFKKQNEAAVEVITALIEHYSAVFPSGPPKPRKKLTKELLSKLRKESGCTVENILQDEAVLPIYGKFAREGYVDEDLQCYLHIMEWKRKAAETGTPDWKTILEIYQKYIKAGSDSEVNISGLERKNLSEIFLKAGEDPTVEGEVKLDAFDILLSELVALMRTNSFARFMESTHMDEILTEAYAKRNGDNSDPFPLSEK